MNNKAAFIIVILVMFASSLACGSTTPVTGAPPEQQDTQAPQSINTSRPTETVRPTSTPPPPTATPDPNRISSGTYLVGAEIQPGLYQGQAGEGLFGSCYWARLKDLTGGLDSILANDNATGQFYIQVNESDMALKTDCDLVFLPTMPVPVSTFPETVDVGTFLVGIEILPGLYKGTEDSCYWARLKDLTGELDSLIANGNSKGQFYVEVSPSDKALHVGCPLAFLASPEPVSSFPQVIPPGMYLVGIDFQPGTYKGQAGDDFLDSCYWARLKNLSGDLYSILANDNANGQFYVQVNPSDKALETGCELTRVEGQ